MIIIRNKSYIQASTDIISNLWPSLIWEVSHISSEVDKDSLEGVVWEANEGYEHGFFIGIRYVVHAVLGFLKIFRLILLKINLSGRFLLCCFLYRLFFLSSIFSHHPEFSYFFSSSVYSWSWIRVIPRGDFLKHFSLTLFWFNISIFYFFVSWRGDVVCYLKELYTAYWRTIFLDDFWIAFVCSKNIRSSFLISCTLIG